MERTLEKILKGEFDYEKGSLSLSMPKIEVSVCPDEIYEGTFTISGEKESDNNGFIYSDDIRMTLSTDRFEGSDETIAYSFSARGLIPGDVSCGEICIISNRGEFFIPYVFSVKNTLIDSSLGGIKNLFHFTNLAKANWEEAVKLFYKDEFMKLFVGNDKQYKKTYLGFSRYYGNEQNVDNFLVEINKKKEIEYILESETLSLTDPEHLSQECIQITRNGWGYTFLNVKADSDFIILDKIEITDNDFLGNYLNYSFRINADALHGGNNYASITFYNANVNIVAKVVAGKPVYSKAEISARVLYENQNYEMMSFFEAFRTRQINMETWLHETDRIVSAMQDSDARNPVPKLFKAQLLITEERFNEAQWLLSQVRGELDSKVYVSPATEAYYLYLSALNNREESYIDEVTTEVSKLYANNPSEWRIAWMLLYLSEEYAVSPTKKWMFIAEQINKQCSSPMFYVEAVNMLTVNAGLLTELGDYEIKVLRYAAENDVLTDDMVDQFAYLAGSLRSFSEPVYKILTMCYERKPSVTLVEVIVKLLIKGNRKNTEYNDWYLKAINHELRVTKLFEYYFESLDLSTNVDIPKMVYLYFSYQSNLDYERAAYLYSKVISLQEEMPEIYASYSDRIREFAIDEIKKGHINKDLVSIYKFVLPMIPVSEDFAGSLSTILFMHKIVVPDSRITRALVYQNRENFETAYPVRNGVVYVPIYNKDFTILFEDSLTNRYMKSIEYDLEKLMVPGKIATQILPFVKDNIEFDVYACECSSAMVEINDENRDRYRAIMESPYIDPEYRGEIREKLMEYYYEADMMRELDDLLGDMSPAFLSQKERAKAIAYMIIRGMFDVAFEWVISFGTENVDLKDIVKLCSKLIMRSEFQYDRFLLKLSSLAFFGNKFDENILKYLSLYYKGMTKSMRKIFRAACEYLPDAGDISERIIVQTLYTGYFVPEKTEVYKKYVQAGASIDIRCAYIAQNCFDYFVKEQITDPYLFEEIEKLYTRDIPLLKVCKLTFLKYHADIKDDYEGLTAGMINEFINEMVDENLYFNFFLEYVGKSIEKVNKFSDKTIIEYRTVPGRKVWMHYIIESENGDSSDYSTEEMPEMYDGIYVKPFTLFYGENLLYYISESDDNDEQLTESGNIQKSDINNGMQYSRFSEINDIVVATSLRDYDTANKMLYESKKRDYLISKIFKLQ